MNKSEDDLISNIGNLVKKYEKDKKAKQQQPVQEQKPIDKNVTLTVDELTQLVMKSCNQNVRPNVLFTTTEETTDEEKPVVVRSGSGPIRQFEAIPEQPNVKPAAQKQIDNKKQIALQIYKDSMSTIFVCLIAMILPLICVLITMFPSGEMVAFIVGFVGLVYPVIVLGKMVSLQSRLYHKYGFRPMFTSKPQRRIPGRQKMVDEKDMML